MRLIDADALEQIITEKFKEHYGDTVYQFIHDFFRFVIRQIRRMPTIEAEPVKHGRWIDVREYCGDFMCSNCDALYGTNKFNYCPNCGATMDGGNNDA